MIEIEQGTVKVDAISGFESDNYAIYYITIDQKAVTAEVWVEGPSGFEVSILPTDGMGEVTNVRIPKGWAAEASASKYSVRVIAVRPDRPQDLAPIPFEVVSRKKEEA